MKKFNKMTALCSESFVHYCQTEKESEGGKEKERERKQSRFVSGLQNISTTRNAEQKKSEATTSTQHSLRRKYTKRETEKGYPKLHILGEGMHWPQRLSAGLITVA